MKPKDILEWLKSHKLTYTAPSPLMTITIIWQGEDSWRIEFEIDGVKGHYFYGDSLMLKKIRIDRIWILRGKKAGTYEDN